MHESHKINDRDDGDRAVTQSKIQMLAHKNNLTICNGQTDCVQQNETTLQLFNVSVENMNLNGVCL